MTPEQFETAADALQVCVADLIRDLLAAPEYAEFIDRQGKEFNDARVCVDCAHVIANGEAPDDAAPDYAFPDDGLEWYLGDADDDTEFSWQSCDGCGSPLGGARYAAKWADPATCADVGMELTVSAPDDLSDYAWQTGDNSYSGGAYAFPHWGIATLTRDADPDSIAAEIVSQIADAAYYAAVEE